MYRLRVAVGCAAGLALGLVALSGPASTGGARAGVSGADVSGFVISGVDYRLAADPTRVAGVSFLLDADPEGEIRIRLSESQGWVPCRVEGRRVSCSLAASLALRDVGRLDVVAAA